MHKFKGRSNKTFCYYVDYNYVIYFCKHSGSLYFYEFIDIFKRNFLKNYLLFLIYLI